MRVTKMPWNKDI